MKLLRVAESIKKGQKKLYCLEQAGVVGWVVRKGKKEGEGERSCSMGRGWAGRMTSKHGKSGRGRKERENSGQIFGFCFFWGFLVCFLILGAIRIL